MSGSLPWFILVSSLSLLLHSSADAQTQKRNFNLSCGLIGNFARYPQHNNLCKWQVFCSDPKTCMRKLAVPRKDLEAVLSLEEAEAPVGGEPPPQGWSLSVGVQGSISAGGLNASGNVNAGAGTDSGGGASGSGSASAGASGDGGGANTGAGGGLGIGGL